MVDEALSLVGHQVALQGVDARERGRAGAAHPGRLRPAPPGVRQHHPQRVRGDAEGRHADACAARAPAGGQHGRDRVSRTPAWASRRTGWRRSSTRSSPPRRRAPGSGLSVVYGIIERHGGTLDIKSEVGEGTTVVVAPAGRRAASEAVSVAETARPMARGRAPLVDRRRRGRRPRCWTTVRARTSSGVFGVQARPVPPRATGRTHAFDPRRGQHSSTRDPASGWSGATSPARRMLARHRRRPVHPGPDLRVRRGAARRPRPRSSRPRGWRVGQAGRHDPALVADRVVKECVHELGHTFGLLHCDTPGCVMTRSVNLARGRRQERRRSATTVDVRYRELQREGRTS